MILYLTDLTENLGLTLFHSCVSGSILTHLRLNISEKSILFIQDPFHPKLHRIVGRLIPANDRG